MKKYLTIERVNLLIAFDNFFFLLMGNAMKKREKRGESSSSEWIGENSRRRESSRERDANEGRERMHVCICEYAFTRVLASTSRARLVAELRAK